MAEDLAGTPASGPRVQACGDCHLLNFGAFATPERRVIFDINDFDETLPAPWEWDLKRLATSFVLACRENHIGEDTAADIAHSCARAYREAMAEFAGMRALDVWYASTCVEDVIAGIKDDQTRRRARRRLERALGRDPLEHDYPKLVDGDAGSHRIRDQYPLLFHWDGQAHEEQIAIAEEAFRGYRATLSEARRTLLDRFRIQDIAIKVVGIGSVGTFCCILLLMAGEDDPLFLQVKEAGPSVLEPFADTSRAGHHGRRVVVGTQLLQSASDLFLGWTEGRSGRQFYLRQLRDAKIGMQVELFEAGTMGQYASLCGRTLARGHARTGHAATIAGYLGTSERFDSAIAAFSSRYADQAERDHSRFLAAARSGRIAIATEDF